MCHEKWAIQDLSLVTIIENYTAYKYKRRAYITTWTIKGYV